MQRVNDISNSNGKIFADFGDEYQLADLLILRLVEITKLLILEQNFVLYFTFSNKIHIERMSKKKMILNY